MPDPTKTILDGTMTVSGLIVLITTLIAILGSALGLITFLRAQARERTRENSERDDRLMNAINDRDKAVHDKLREHHVLIDTFWKRPEIEAEFVHQRANVDTVSQALLRRIEQGGKEHHELSLEVARLHERMNMRDVADKELKEVLKDLQGKITDIAIKQGVR